MTGRTFSRTTVPARVVLVECLTCNGSAVPADGETLLPECYRRHGARGESGHAVLTHFADGRLSFSGCSATDAARLRADLRIGGAR